MARVIANEHSPTNWLPSSTIAHPIFGSSNGRRRLSAKPPTLGVMVHVSVESGDKGFNRAMLQRLGAALGPLDALENELSITNAPVR